MSGRQAEKLFGVTRRILSKEARVRGFLPTTGRPRRYPLRDDAFSGPLTPMMAYLLGLLAADGSVYFNRRCTIPRIALAVKWADRCLVEMLCAFLETPSARISSGWRHDQFGNEFQVAKVEVCSAQLADDLARYGVIAGKTHRLCFPTMLPPALMSHWLRGFWDGDGSMSYQTDGVHQLHISVCGTEDVVGSVEAFLRQQCQLPAERAVHLNGRSETNFVVAWRARDDVRAIAAYLYRDGGATYCLPRKLDAVVAALGLRDSAALEGPEARGRPPRAPAADQEPAA